VWEGWRGGEMKWLIVFPDSWLAYSPSCINFAKMLEKNGHEYLILCPEDDGFDNSNLLSIKKKNVFSNQVVLKILDIKGLRRLRKCYKIYCFYRQIKSMMKKDNFDRFVGIDEIGYIVAYLLNKKAIYYSLEVSHSFLNRFIFDRIKPLLLIIQSKERKDYLKYNGFTIYIQNSPVLKKQAIQKEYGKKLIYFGHLLPSYDLDKLFDSLYYLDEILYVKYLKKKDTEYRDYLFDRYKDLISKERIIFDDSYIEQDSVIDYIYDFDIGFCFYDKESIENDFNYASSPSGKMFNYFAAGVPIVANDTIGFNPVKQFNAGVLLRDVDSSSIINAIGEIRENYEFFRENSIRAGIEFDYERMFNENREKIFSITHSI
jgi:hypothetical protein